MKNTHTLKEQKIRDALSRNGITQAELARKLFVSRDTVHKWIVGRHRCHEETINKICDILNVDAHEITKGVWGCLPPKRF